MLDIDCRDCIIDLLHLNLRVVGWMWDHTVKFAHNEKIKELLKDYVEELTGMSLDMKSKKTKGNALFTLPGWDSGQLMAFQEFDLYAQMQQWIKDKKFKPKKGVENDLLYRAGLFTTMWNHYFALYLKLTFNLVKSDTDIEEYFVNGLAYLDACKAATKTDRVTPYMHILCHHAPEQAFEWQDYGGLYVLCNQTVEAVNKNVKAASRFLCYKKANDVSRQLLCRMDRLDFAILNELDKESLPKRQQKTRCDKRVRKFKFVEMDKLEMDRLEVAESGKPPQKRRKLE